jgi:hypothetical protein
MPEDYPEWFVALIHSITAKRPRIVAEHILKHGAVTTAELEALYGYKHPPRAARDLREAGIPLETFRVKDTEGRTIAAYRFGDLMKVRQGRLSGRRIFAKKFKKELVSRRGSRCAICNGVFEERYLQIDHRVPYEVAGDDISSEQNFDDYMLLCGECNRAKSWSCEHCANWISPKSADICQQCYWAQPQNYKHVALKEIRRADVIWTEAEIEIYDKIREQANRLGEAIPEFIKKILEKHFSSL